MSNETKKWAVAIVAAFLFGGVASFLLLNRHFNAKLEALTPQVVECTKTDTITQIKPVFVAKKIIIHDTIKIPITDTLWRKDTIFLPREQVVYGDSSYRAVVSGIEPRLDTIQVYQKTITKIATQKEWRKFTYGVQLGVGLVAPFNASPSFGGYIGVGIGYNF